LNTPVNDIFHIFGVTRLNASPKTPLQNISSSHVSKPFAGNRGWNCKHMTKKMVQWMPGSTWSNMTKADVTFEVPENQPTRLGTLKAQFICM